MDKRDVTSADEIRRGIADLGEWFHNIDLRGVKTAPHHPLGDFPSFKWMGLSQAIPANLDGWTVLDIGCNAGFYALEMKRRGADRVVGIDSDGRHLAQARFAADVLGVDIELEQLSVFEVAWLREKFDLVLFMGGLHRLRHPLLALDLIHEHVARKMVVVQSMLRGETKRLPLQPDYSLDEREIFTTLGYPKMYFVENRYAGDPTNWWIPNAGCLEAMVRSAGFRVLSQPEPEVFVCEYLSRDGDESLAAYAVRGVGDHD